MLKKKRFFSYGIIGLLLCGVLSVTPFFSQDGNIEALGLSRNNRYTNSVAISQAGWTQASTVIISTGLDYADTLAASSLAKSKDAPMLLTEKDAMNKNIIAEIKRLKATQAILVGGTGVIGNGVENQLKSLKIGVTRIGGTDIASKTVESVAIKALSLLQQERMSKGGVIGTAGKGVVALRFDDYQTAFGKEIYPLLIERGLPASMALISRFNTAQSWGKGTTWDQVRNWNRNGVEIWSHGTDHKDYSSQGYAGLYSQIVSSKVEIEAQNIKVVGFALPGVAPSTKNLPYDGLTKPSDYNGKVGSLLMQTYALSEAYAYPPPRILPTKVYHGLNHHTVSDGKGTLWNSKEAINIAIKNKSGIELMCHTSNLGKPGNMTLAEFTTLLDYIKTQWDNGSIEVLTPSGLFFADPNSSKRLRIEQDGSFEGLTVANSGAWKGTNSWTGKTMETGVGRTGEKFLRIDSSITNSGVTQKISSLDELRVLGEQFVFEGWARAYGKGSTTGIIEIKDYNNSNKLKITNKVVCNGSSWRRVRFVFSIPPNTNTIALSLYRIAGTSIDWDDISIKKI